jgi:hypothetical protein
MAAFGPFRCATSRSCSEAVNQGGSGATFRRDALRRTFDLMASIRAASPIPRHPDAARIGLQAEATTCRTPGASPPRGSFLWR